MSKTRADVAGFANLTQKFWNSHFETLMKHYGQGELHGSGISDPVPALPSLLLVTELPDHFVVELLGSRRTLKSLRVKKHKLSSPNVYFGQFQLPDDAPGMIHLNTHHNSIRNLCLVGPTDNQERIEARFPGVLDQFPTKLLFARDKAGYCITVGPECDFVNLSHCLLVNTYNQAVRMRHIRVAVILKKSSSFRDFGEYLSQEFPVTPNVELSAWVMLERGYGEAENRASQFANAFLLSRLRETTIGAFLEDHDEIVTLALGGSRMIYEPSCPWQVASPDPEETAINPDFFLVHEDGTIDIWDLKLPLLDNVSVTVSKRRRRKFISSVEDGIAQLAHYKEFLAIPENKSWVENRYEVKLIAPKFGLVVGNYENASGPDMSEALRRFPDLEVVNYDAIAQAYLAKIKTQS